jgi:hypothetical protein
MTLHLAAEDLHKTDSPAPGAPVGAWAYLGKR